MSEVIFNEIEPKTCAWLRENIKAGLCEAGEVNEGSIDDVIPNELATCRQFHAFAGIGIWSYALRLAGWPRDWPVWTASCPCQSFSTAGQRKGFADERHLWPAFFWLVEQCRPPVLFLEQVDSKDGLAWLDLVLSDLEGIGYAVGPTSHPAAGFGAPHARHRLYIMAHDDGQRGGRSLEAEPATPRSVGQSGGAGLQGCEQRAAHAEGQGAHESAAESGSLVRGFWEDCDWLPFADPRYGLVWRPVEPGTLPLVDGAPARVLRLRGYGNGIVAPQAAEFIRAGMAYLYQ